MKPEVKLKFEPRDIWVGVYWNMVHDFVSRFKHLDVYICIIPMLPVRLRWVWDWKVMEGYEEHEEWCALPTQHTWCDCRVSKERYRL